MNKNILEINYFHIELGHTLEEYKEQFGTLYEEGDLWDYSLEDVKTNAVEGDFNTLYWGIVVDNELRVFETTIRKEFEINYQLVKDYIFFVYTKNQNNCVIDAYNEWGGTEFAYTKEVITKVILQDYEFLKYVFLEECFFMYKWLSDHHCYIERNIRLIDDCESLFVTTNAPSFLIEEAINYRDMVLENNLPFCSDFECMQEYINEKGFTFEEINVSDESYYW
jgi:hypothetical protein